MPADLPRLYSALAHDTDVRTLMNPEALRRRSDRRVRVMTTGVAAGVTLVIASAAVVGLTVLRSSSVPVGTTPPTVTTSTTTPATTATRTPTRTPPPATGPIPDRAFLVPPPATVYPGGEPSDGATLFALCGSDLRAPTGLGQQRARLYTFYDPKRGPTEDLPLGTAGETILVYASVDAARTAVQRLRDLVASCSRELGDGGTYTYRLVGDTTRGDENVLMERHWAPPGGTAGPGTAPPTTTLLYALRVGDAVILLDVSGWEGIDVDRSISDQYADLAVTAVRSWRG